MFGHWLNIPNEDGTPSDENVWNCDNMCPTDTYLVLNNYP